MPSENSPLQVDSPINTVTNAAHLVIASASDWVIIAECVYVINVPLV